MIRSRLHLAGNSVVPTPPVSRRVAPPLCFLSVRQGQGRHDLISVLNARFPFGGRAVVIQEIPELRTFGPSQWNVIMVDAVCDAINGEGFLADVSVFSGLIKVCRIQSSLERIEKIVE